MIMYARIYSEHFLMYVLNSNRFHILQTTDQPVLKKPVQSVEGKQVLEQMAIAIQLAKQTISLPQAAALQKNAIWFLATKNEKTKEKAAPDNHERNNNKTMKTWAR